MNLYFIHILLVREKDFIFSKITAHKFIKIVYALSETFIQITF